MTWLRTEALHTEALHAACNRHGRCLPWAGQGCAGSCRLDDAAPCQGGGADCGQVIDQRAGVGANEGPPGNGARAAHAPALAARLEDLQRQLDALGHHAVEAAHPGRALLAALRSRTDLSLCAASPSAAAVCPCNCPRHTRLPWGSSSSLAGSQYAWRGVGQRAPAAHLIDSHPGREKVPERIEVGLPVCQAAEAAAVMQLRPVAQHMQLPGRVGCQNALPAQSRAPQDLTSPRRTRCAAEAAPPNGSCRGHTQAPGVHAGGRLATAGDGTCTLPLEEAGGRARSCSVRVQRGVSARAVCTAALALCCAELGST